MKKIIKIIFTLILIIGLSLPIIIPSIKATNISGSMSTYPDSSQIFNIGETPNYHIVITNTDSVESMTVDVTVVDPHGDIYLLDDDITIPSGDSEEYWFSEYTIVEEDIIIFPNGYEGIVNTLYVDGFQGADIVGLYVKKSNLVIPAYIDIVKEADITTATIGQTITYTFTVTNCGDDTITSVTVVDNKLGSITLGTTTLAPGASTAGTATHIVVEGDLPSPIVNTATGTGTTSTGGTVTDTDIESVTISDLTTGLVGYWNFDEGAGSIAHDSSGNNNDGIINGATWKSSGKVNGALEFDGIDDYLEVQHSDLLTPSDTITISLWAQEYSSSPAFSCLIYKPGEEPTSSGFKDRIYTLWTHNLNNIHFTSTPEGESSQICCNTPNEVYLLNQFFMITALIDTYNDYMAIFVNGEKINDCPYLGENIRPGNYPLRIGAPFVTLSDQYNFNGLIDEVRIYNRALSETEIQELFNQGSGNQPTEFWVEVSKTPGTYMYSNSVDFSFERNLKQGIERGEDVRYLQAILNTNPITIVSPTGAGSPGRETDYYGSKTKDAVNKLQELFQELYPDDNFIVNGEVDTKTREKLNEIEYLPIKYLPQNWVLKLITENGVPMEDTLDGGIRWFYKVEDITDNNVGWIERGDLKENANGEKTKLVIFQNDSEKVIDFVFTKTNLEYGLDIDDNSDIKFMQIILKHLGFFPADQSITGGFFDITKNAVALFQNSFEPKLDEGNGVVDTETVEKLNIYLNERCTLDISRASLIYSLVNLYYEEYLTSDFPIELALAIPCVENGVYLDNEYVIFEEDDFGRGIMQITSDDYVGYGSHIKSYDNGCNFGSCEDEDKKDCKSYYTNTVQGIEVNIKDGLANLRDKYFDSLVNYHFEQCIAGENGWDACEKYGISCDEMRWISAVQRYNGYSHGYPSRYLAWYDEDGVLVNGIAYWLKHLEDTFNYPNNMDLASKIEKLKIIGIKIFSPCYIQTIDSYGRICGLFDNVITEEIPHSMYDMKNEGVMIFFPMDNYKYNIIGNSIGDYNVTIIFFNNSDNIEFFASFISISNNELHQYIIDWNALSKGDEGVTIQIDNDGDGIFERTITSDSELTQDEFILLTETIIDIDPDAIVLKDKARWITCYTELPEDFNVSNITISSILLNNIVPAESKPIKISDYDYDGIPELMVKFSKSEVAQILQPGDNVEITVSGELLDGTKFESVDYIRVI